VAGVDHAPRSRWALVPESLLNAQRRRRGGRALALQGQQIADQSLQPLRVELQVAQETSGLTP
jgi:hypothetical protein